PQAGQGGFPGGFPGGGPGGRDSGRGAPAPKVNVHYVTSDERSNTVYVNARPNKIAQVKSLMTTLDQPQPKELAPLMQTYYIPAGNADSLVKMIQEIPAYRPSNSLKMQAISPTQIMIWGAPDDHLEIARYLQPAKTPANVTETIPLTVLEAAKVAETLKGMLGDAKGGAPFIEGEPSRNVVTIRGSAEQVREVKLIIQAMGENPTGSMRVISLEKGSAATLADALQRLLPQMRDNEVRVILPGGDTQVAPKATPMPPAIDLKKTSHYQQGPALTPTSFLQNQQLADPAAEAKPARLQGKPVTITAFGNKLIVLSEDPQALALVQELVRLMTKTEAGEGDFEVIRLKNANATEIARIIDEAFNGSKQGGQQGGGRGGAPGGGGFNPISALTGGLGGMLQSAIGGSPAQRVERVRIVADPATNSLLVRATPLDMLTIRNILSKSLDTGETDSNAVARTWMIGPLKHANASEVANVIQSVYRENLNVNSQQARVGGMPGFGFPFGGQQQQPQRQNSTTFSLSVGIDQRSNSL
ncbi:MAG: secretin N-terminal domain-containing protein, partial [Planctomycetota bacterium]